VQTWVDIPFADGAYRFSFGLMQIAELEKKCDAGLGKIYARTLAGRYGLKADDVLPLEADYRFAELIEVIRQGLIGGDHGIVDGVVVPVRANDLVSAYLFSPSDHRMPVKETWALAASVLSALVEGYVPPKKKADQPEA
jgi:hypothetical protein